MKDRGHAGGTVPFDRLRTGFRYAPADAAATQDEDGGEAPADAAAY